MKIHFVEGYKIKAELKGKEREITKITNAVAVSTIKGLILNPYLYYNGDVEGIVKITDFNYDIEFTPREGSRKEELLRRLILKYTATVEEAFELDENAFNVTLLDVVPYGEWKVGAKNRGVFEIFLDLPYFLLKDTYPKNDIYMGDLEIYFKDFEPAFLMLDDTLLAFRHIHKDVWKAVKSRDADAIFEIKWGNVSLADLIIPLYYRVIEVNVDDWVFKHLPRAVASAYLLSLREMEKAPQDEGNRRLREILFATEDISIIKLLSLYVKNKVKFAKLIMEGVQMAKDMKEPLKVNIEDGNFYTLYRRGVKNIVGGEAVA